MNKDLLNLVSLERLRTDLFHFCRDPFPFRTVSYTKPWHTRHSLDEFDDFLADEIRRYTDGLEIIDNKIQAFRCDESKPLHHWYSSPKPEDPWYTGHNLVVTLPGSDCPDEIIQLISHKDSMSWICAPGAQDNAVGAAANLEIIRVLSKLPHHRTIRVLFCNEEHCPWHSLTFAKVAKERGDNIIAVLNQDSLCGKSDEETAKGIRTNVTCYSTPEGKKLADFVVREASVYGLPLEVKTVFKEYVNDDDGSFIKAGYPCTCMNLGSFPYTEPNYHLPGDVPERVDYVNLQLATQQILAAVLDLDEKGIAALD